MPFRKSPKTLRKTYNKKKTVSTKSFAARVRSVVKKTAETKYLIRNATEATSYGSTLTSPASTSRLNEVNEGFTENTRVGNKINPFLINIRGSLTANTMKPVISKIYILESNISNDPTLDMLENNAGQFAPTASDLTAIYARINTRKYKVLKVITLKTGTVSGHTGDLAGTKLFNVNIKLNGTYEYLDGSSLCQKRNLMLVPIYRQLQNDIGTSGETMELTWNSKLYFKDP